MSIRLRLTLLYSALLALTLILFSTVLYAAQARYTQRIIQNDLIKTAKQLSLAWERIQQGPMRLTPHQPGDRDAMHQHILKNLRQIAALQHPRDIIRLLDAEGQPLALTMNEDAPALSLSRRGLTRLQRGRPTLEIASFEKERFLIYSEPVRGPNGLIGIVQAARSLADRDRSLRSLGFTLILGSAATTLIAFGVGWWLSGVTLRPIQRITRAAREIGEARDFSSRVAYNGPPDELGRLAMTFNRMLSQLQEAFEQISHALQVQRDFVADVSHELRTPLTTIRGNLDLLRRDPPLPAAEEEDILEDLVGESERLSRLVRDLLTLARADTGRKLTLGPTAIPPLIEEICRQARLLAPEREIACELTTDDAVAWANEDALKQVLLILVDNAIKHAYGPIRIAVDTAETPQADGQIAITVADSGPGMSEALQARIFDRFYRGDSSRTTPGFGLGLSIAHALVTAQHGKIAVESEIARGTQFTVQLPTTAPEESEA
ncbi:MAG: sensor histidine kinase [Anaerolineales bacterium]